jgi:hypothetical protein
MINRYDNPQIFKYESQFVPTELPWDIIQNSIDKEQKKRDDYKTDVAKIGDVKASGLNNPEGHWAQQMNITDYSDSIAEINDLNTDIGILSKEITNSELTSDHYYKMTQLQKRKNEIEQRNVTRLARQTAVEGYQKERADKKVNSGDYRDFPFQIEMDRMANDKTYVPTTHGIQDAFDPAAFVNKAMTGIASEVQDDWIKNKDGYIEKYMKSGVMPKKIETTMWAAFNSDPELQQDMALEAQQLQYMNGGNEILTIDSVNEKGEKIQIQKNVMEYVQEKRWQNVKDIAMSRVSETIAHTKTGDAWGQSKIDEKLLASPDLTVKTYNIKGRNILEAATLWGDMKRQSDNADKTILENNTLLATLKAQGGGKIPAGMEDKALEYQNNINQAQTTKFNRKLLEDKAWKNIKNTIDAAPIGTSKKEVSAILNSSTSKQDAYTKLKNKYGQEIAKQITFNVDSDIDNKVSQMLITDNREVNSVQFVYSMASKENQALYKDLVNAATIGQGGLVAFNEDGTEIDSRNLIFDETSGFGSDLDEQGNQIITMRTKPGDNWWEPSELVTLKLNPETTIGKKIINKTRSNALSNAEYAASVGDKESEKHYLKIADQASHQTTAMETDFNMILQSGNLTTIDVALSGLEFNESKDYMYSDGDQKMRFIFTSATTNKDDMNKKFKVSAKIWRNNTWESADEVLKGRKYFDGALNLINTINGQQ